jgi:1,4-dihydroxy-2-naphthoate octaprenyltransferase
VMFIVLSATYALKKRFPGIAYISFLYNGGLKVMLVMDIGQRWPVLLAIGLLMTLRNLMGDVRDAGKDVSEGVRSLPVAMGLRRNVPYVYPAALAITSTIWTIYGHLPIWTLVLALIVQATTYKLTPR